MRVVATNTNRISNKLVVSSPHKEVGYDKNMRLLTGKIEIEIQRHTSDGGVIILSKGNAGEIQMRYGGYRGMIIPRTPLWHQPSYVGFMNWQLEHSQIKP